MQFDGLGVGIVWDFLTGFSVVFFGGWVRIRGLVRQVSVCLYFFFFRLGV